MKNQEQTLWDIEAHKGQSDRLRPSDFNKHNSNHIEMLWRLILWVRLFLLPSHLFGHVSGEEEVRQRSEEEEARRH